MIPGVISQRDYPGAGDIDDCWVVATVWAAVASRPAIHRPTVPEFRKAAGIPDVQGKPNGGDIDAVAKGARGVWDISVTVYKASGWAAFLGDLKKGMPASIALDSGDLPPAHQYGFKGKHQCGGIWDGTTLRLANPLAKAGSRPKPITGAQLLKACRGLVSSGKIHAVLFPAPAPSANTVSIHPPAGQARQTFVLYAVSGPTGHITSARQTTTKGFSAAATASRHFDWPAKQTDRHLVQLTTGSRSGSWVDAGWSDAP